jgi:exopolysaccharide biosynthesis WecB/TagA/CpsF family protein
LLNAPDQTARARILGVEIARLHRSEAIALLLARLNARQRTAVTFANTNLLNLCRRDAGLRVALDDMLVLNDGIGVDIASWILYGAKFPENLNGTDFNPALLSALPAGTRVFLYGARPDVVARAGRLLAATYPIEICGAVDGYADDAGAVADAAARVRADVILVALGNPLQERWIADHARRTGATLTLGVGAYFDFVTGRVARAPAWVRRMRCEWIYRLLLEPKRLWRRYTLDLVSYLAAVGALRLRRHKAPA